MDSIVLYLTAFFFALFVPRTIFALTISILSGWSVISIVLLTVIGFVIDICCIS